jgi:anti-sigma factor RsiW
MNCPEVHAVLDDFVDGALAERERREVARHLQTCPECRRAETGLRELLAKAEALPKEAEPVRDLWPGIAERIEAGNVVAADFTARRRRPAAVWAAGAAALLVGAAALVAVVLVRGDLRSRVAAAPGRPAAAGVMQASLELAQARATYATARVQLLAALEARKATLSPATAAVVEKNLKIIDGAVAEMQAALARDPGNREIPALLVAAYQQEIDLLQRATSLPGRG